jgi:hypothetical protein
MLAAQSAEGKRILALKAEVGLIATKIAVTS